MWHEYILYPVGTVIVFAENSAYNLYISKHSVWKNQVKL